MGMLPSPLGRDIGHCALQNLQQGLLDPLAGHIPGDGGVLALSGDLIHLIDVDDAPLRQLHIIVRRLDQPQEDVLHIVPHIAGLCQRGGVRDGEGDLQDPGQGLGKQGLAASRGTNEQDVALLQLHIAVPAEENALVMIVHRHRQGDLRPFLADDILIQHLPDLPGGGDAVRHLQHLGNLLPPLVGHLLPKYPHAQMDTFIADKGAGAGYDTLYLILILPAEGAANGFFFVIFSHKLPLVDAAKE